jgi:hypothetical protein
MCIIWKTPWISWKLRLRKGRGYLRTISHHHHRPQYSPFWAITFIRRFCQIASGFHLFAFRNSNCFTEQGRQPFVQPPAWRTRSLYLYPPGTGWPSYTPRHRVPFSPSSTTRRATAEVFDPASTRGQFYMYKLNKERSTINEKGTYTTKTLFHHALNKRGTSTE